MSIFDNLGHLFGIFGYVFVGEIADKTMLVTIALVAANPTRVRYVLLGVAPASYAVSILGVGFSAMTKSALTGFELNFAVTILYLGLAVWSMLERLEEVEEAAHDSGMSNLRLSMVSFGAFFTAEMMDRTQGITITMSGDTFSLILILLEVFAAGSALFASNYVAVRIYQKYKQDIPRQLLMYYAAVLFLASGLSQGLSTFGMNDLSRYGFIATVALFGHPWLYRHSLPFAHFLERTWKLMVLAVVGLILWHWGPALLSWIMGRISIK